MTPAQIRFLSLLRREVNRFMKIKRQTVGAPLLETFLYISVFGAALGSRIHHLHGFRYIVFVVPGLIMMAWAMNAFSNNSSSILQQKFQRAIDDQLSSPASPLELLLAFTFGGFLRGMMVATLTFIAADILVGIPLHHPLVLFPGVFFVGFFFAHQRARSILTEHQESLTKISEILVKRETIEKEEFLALLEGKSEQEVFGVEQTKPELPPAPPVPADRAEREAPRAIPRPGLAGGTAELRGSDPERPGLT